MNYLAATDRYEQMNYKRCGNSGVKLPLFSLGLWHNFGHVEPLEKGRQILRRAFDLGVTHFDLANNYGPPYGSAEENFGLIFMKDFLPYRDELFLSSKAGYDMWSGPYGDWGSRKYLVASCDQSLKRMQVKYVDLFYSHRYDPETPLEETMGALDYIVRSGRALYVGISNYPPEQTRKAVSILNELGTPCLIHQVKYSMLERSAEQGLLEVLQENGVGCIAFSPLAQGLLTDKYLKGIPEDSRAGKNYGYLWPKDVEENTITKITKLNELATHRDQSLAQMALAWLLKDARVTSVLIGVSSVDQLEDSLAAKRNLGFSRDQLEKISQILSN
ncbi:MAG: L-glyceraldehyde 3-phosphate reductase [Cyclobacteriaceae bacterium]